MYDNTNFGDSNGAANNDDDTTTMYDTILQTGDSDDNNDFSTVGNKWTLGDHSTLAESTSADLADTLGQTMAVMDDDVDDDMMAVMEDAMDLVEDTSVRSFECPVEECGLHHSHSDHKHDVRAGFNVESAFADEMAFCPYCHCGVNELAMMMPYFGYISVPVFEDQYKFEAVLELDSRLLQQMVLSVISDEKNVTEASMEAGSNPGVRGEVRMFLNRVEEIQAAANSAPIAGETRRVIGENRDALAEAVQE
jgi:hypothetical protein